MLSDFIFDFKYLKTVFNLHLKYLEFWKKIIKLQLILLLFCKLTISKKETFKSIFLKITGHHYAES